MPMAEPDSNPPQGATVSTARKRLFGLLRIALTVAILAWIASTLPWNDTLSWYDASGDASSLEGEILEDWKQDSVSFQVLDGARPPAGWPAEAGEAAARGEAFLVTRRTSGEVSGFEWQPSMPTAFKSMAAAGLIGGMALFVFATFLSSTRWWRLLALSGCRTTWFNAFRLTYVGFAFNLVMPGLTGGDLVKGVIAAKENPKRRADAVVSVVVDRVIGLTALALLAVIVILLSGDTFAALRLPLIGLLAFGGVTAGLYANRGLRKRIGLSALVDRLPGGDKLRSLDRAALLYLEHPAEVGFAFLLSFGNHLVVCVGVFVLAWAIGVDTEVAGVGEFLVLAPVANMISAIPLAPGGWGVGEFVYRELFEMIELSGALGVAVSVTFRLCMLVGLGAIGSLFLLFPGVRADVREMESPPEREAPETAP